MANYLSNAFSLQMLKSEKCGVKIRNIEKSEIPFDDIISVIGHEDIANILNVKVNRVNTKLNENDVLYVAQYIGDRLPEGATKLPKDAIIKFFKITLQYKYMTK